MKSRLTPMNIVLPTQLLFEEINALSVRHAIEEHRLEPKAIISVIMSQWLVYNTDDSSRYLFHMTDLVDFLETCVIEDFLSTHQAKEKEFRVVSIAIIKHLVRKFIYEMVPIIDSFGLTERHLSTAKITWLGTSLVLDVME